MPASYAARFGRAAIRHYHAAARIDGRWVPLDSSYSRPALALIAATEASVGPFVAWDADRDGGYASGVATMGGTDPYAIDVHADLDDVMRKTPSYDAKNAEAMNVRVDLAQGYLAPAPAYVAAMEQALAAGDPRRARAIVLAGVAADAEQVRGVGAAG
jgi:hypothetical protein